MKIVFFDTKDYEEEYLKNNCPNTTENLYLSYPLTKETNLENISDADMISCSVSSDCTSFNLSRFKNLKCIFTRSVGFDHIDLKYCKKNGISVHNTPHYGDWTVAEYTFALILSSSRNILRAQKDLKLGKVDLPSYMGLELHSKTIGIIGLGQIGERVAKIAQGFNMKVLYYDIKDVPEYKKVTLDTLLRSSDFITINCPLNKDTRHLLSHKQFNLVKDGVVIINTARGEIINTKALFEALESGKISYLGLDVLECEYETANYGKDNFCTSCINDRCLKNYILNQKLMNAENSIVTPHIAYNTKEAVVRILELTVKNIENFLRRDFKKIESSKVA